MWQPRAFRHPAAASATAIVPEPLRISARCLVLLFAAQSTPQELPAAEQKILTGMLSVLALQPEDLMLMKVYSSAPDLQLVIDTIRQWQPQSVLQLSMDFAELLQDRALVRTFSPADLLVNPQHKPQAYKDLLTFRKLLDHGTSRRFT